MFKTMLAVLLMILFIGCATIPGDTPSIFPAPDKPDGPKQTYVGVKVEFETEGVDPIDVHEFQWDFGDGTKSDWDDGNESIKYTYKSEGIYEVKVREQCPLKVFKSEWSDEHKITVIKKKTSAFLQWLSN